MGFIRKLIKYLFSFIPRLERKVIFEVRRHDPPPLLKPIAGIRFEQVTAENIALVSHFRSQDVVEQFRKYLAQGDLGVYAFCGDRVVGHGWAALPDGSGRLIWGYMPVTSDTITVMFFSVDPRFRGRKIFQHILAELIRLVFSKTDVSRILSDVAVCNAPSLAGFERVGFRRLCTPTLLKWRGHTIRLARIPKINPDCP